MANVAPAPHQISAGQVDTRKGIDRFIAEKRSQIQQAYTNLGLGTLSQEFLKRAALGTTTEYREILRVIEADQWASEFRQFHGRELVEPGSLKQEGTSAERLRRRKSVTFANIDKIKANFDGDINLYRDTLDARIEVEKEDDDLVRRFGKQRLIDAHLGRGKAQDNLRTFNFLKGLNPVIKQNFNREANLADVERIQTRFGNVARFEEFLGAGVTAKSVLAKIEAQDIGDFGVGDLTEESLQEDIFQVKGATGVFDVSGDLQARIEEARKRREALFTAGQSQVATGLEGGQLVQELF